MSRKLYETAIASHVKNLGEDELRVILHVCHRLALGQQQYGLLDVNDGRDWRKEASEEALDMVVYLTAQLLKEGK